MLKVINLNVDFENNCVECVKTNLSDFEYFYLIVDCVKNDNEKLKDFESNLNEFKETLKKKNCEFDIEKNIVEIKETLKKNTIELVVNYYLGDGNVGLIVIYNED